MEHCSIDKAVATAVRLIDAIEHLAISADCEDARPLLAEAPGACYQVKERGGQGGAVAHSGTEDERTVAAARGVAAQSPSNRRGEWP
jgi:hypothetical protein